MSTRTDHRLRTALDRLARAADDLFKGDTHDIAAVERACRDALELMRERAWSAERAQETCARAAFSRSRVNAIAHDVRRAQLAACITEWCASADLDGAEKEASSSHVAGNRRTA